MTMATSPRGSLAATKNASVAAPAPYVAAIDTSSTSPETMAASAATLVSPDCRTTSRLLFSSGFTDAPRRPGPAPAHGSRRLAPPASGARRGAGAPAGRLRSQVGRQCAVRHLDLGAEVGTCARRPAGNPVREERNDPPSHRSVQEATASFGDPADRGDGLAGDGSRPGGGRSVGEGDTAGCDGRPAGGRVLGPGRRRARLSGRGRHRPLGESVRRR